MPGSLRRGGRRQWQRQQQLRRWPAAALAAATLLALAGGTAATPLLQMAKPTLLLPAGNSSDGPGLNGSNANGDVVFGVQLVGTAQQPVHATLSLQLPPTDAGSSSSSSSSANGSSSAWGAADPADLWLEPESLSWAAEEAGSTKYVRLRSSLELPQALQDALLLAAPADEGSGEGADTDTGAGLLQQQQPLLRVRLASASGAEIAQQRRSTTLLLSSGDSDAGAGMDSSVPLFGFVANQVAYPPQSSSSTRGKSSSSSSSSGEAVIPVRLLAGQLSEVATVRYTLRELSPVPQPFLPTKAMHGFLYFNATTAAAADGSGGAAAAKADRSSSSRGRQRQQQQQAEQLIRLPLAWDRIPPEAEYRLGLELEGVYNARVESQSEAVALHIFGTPKGSCPPGSALKAAGSSSSAGVIGGSVRPAASSSSSSLDPFADDAGFGLSFNGSIIDLSSSFQPDVHEYGAMVESDVSRVTLCLRTNEQGFGSVQIVAAAGRDKEAALLRPAAASVAESACGCSREDGSGSSDAEAAAGDGEGGLEATSLISMFSTSSAAESSSSSSSSCDYRAWVLPLRAGQNKFNITLPPQPLELVQSNDSSSVEAEQYSLAVVRLADPENAELASLTVRTADGSSALLCGPAAEDDERAASQAARRAPASGTLGLLLPPITPPCRPDVLLSMNISDTAKMVSLTPALRRPGVAGVRVEVNGQVLSRGGDVAADQLEDTTATQQQRSNASFLPSAFIMGLQPGSTLDAEVVVVAEDGVTANRYPIRFLVVESANKLSVANLVKGPSSDGSSGGGTSVAAGARPKDWPPSPAEQPMCAICPAGWAADAVNSSSCQMCAPGSVSRSAQSPACLPCRPGTFAYSWGSSYCKNCIAGTYAPTANSALCRMCPANTTTLEDGQSSCDVPLTPDTHQEPRYAVVVSFDVILTGVEPEDVVVRAGVNAGYQTIITNLIRTDTALAFNISIDDVQVMSVQHVARRTLSANVTATLGVDVPAGATDEDISAALEVERLSADDPIGMLSSDPDRFFGRTTKTLDVVVESIVQATTESRPGSGTSAGLLWGMLAPGILAILAGSALVFVGCRRSKACGRWRGAAARRLATTRLAPRSLQYSRYVGSTVPAAA